MIRKCLVAVGVTTILAGVAFAEPQRATFVKENRMPGPFKAEIGAIGNYTEIPDDYAAMNNGEDQYRVAPYARYGLGETFAVQAEVPYMHISPSSGDNENGLGDVVLGAEWVVYQDIFSYPFIIPHAEWSLGTGDEDKGMGAGQSLLSAGVSVGTVVMDMFHWIIDGRYTFGKEANDGTGEEKNVFTFGGAFIWDLNEKCSLITEAKASDDKNADGDVPLYIQGGIGVQASENVYVSILGGGAKNTDEDVLVSGKVSYSF